MTLFPRKNRKCEFLSSLIGECDGYLKQQGTEQRDGASSGVLNGCGQPCGQGGESNGEQGAQKEGTMQEMNVLSDGHVQSSDAISANLDRECQGQDVGHKEDNETQHGTMESSVENNEAVKENGEEVQHGEDKENGMPPGGSRPNSGASKA